MNTVGLIFPHQLFHNHPVLEHTNEVYLIEESLFFGDPHTNIQFHKQKLAFHRASMKAYQEVLEKKGVTVHYIEYERDVTIRELKDIDRRSSFVVVDPTDYLLEKRLGESIPNITFLDSPLFINSREDNQEYLRGGKLFMHEFYKWQRKRLNIMVDENGDPEGGRWSFDDENRKKIPKSHYPGIPNDPGTRTNDYVSEAIEYIEKNFADNYGTTDGFSYAVTREQALAELRDFCDSRLHLFGDYEDAIVSERSQLYHSMLSPYMNVGLLSPIEVVEVVLDYSKENNIPINNTEGIVRQIIGWREFIRMVYEEHGTRLRTENQWNFRRELSEKWYKGSTGIDPVDTTINKIMASAYAHHIERLMIIGNFMFLCKIKPDEVYRWFMELFIDAYDWVMVPNVYGMVMQTNKGLMTTKPYISGSNYVKKMSDYGSGEWAEIWDALYWSMIIDNLDELKSNGRMHFVVARAEKFSQEEKDAYLTKREEFYRSL